MNEEIEKKFGIICRELFTIDSELSHFETLELISELSEIIHSGETNESTWSIGESSHCDLGSFIVGCYWYCSECHSGQYSDEYRLLCKLSLIFSPGMTSGPEPDSSEAIAYNALVDKHNEFNKIKLETI